MVGSIFSQAKHDLQGRRAGRLALSRLGLLLQVLCTKGCLSIMLLQLEPTPRPGIVSRLRRFVQEHCACRLLGRQICMPKIMSYTLQERLLQMVQYHSAA